MDHNIVGSGIYNVLKSQNNYILMTELLYKSLMLKGIANKKNNIQAALKSHFKYAEYIRDFSDFKSLIKVLLKDNHHVVNFSKNTLFNINHKNFKHFNSDLTLKELDKYLMFNYVAFINFEDTNLESSLFIVTKVNSNFEYTCLKGDVYKKVPRETVEKLWDFTENKRNVFFIRKIKDKKIFGIGLSRTGNASLSQALIELDYFIVKNPYNHYSIDKADASIDINVSSIFKELDKKYPGSKFILTTRAFWPWMLSIKKHYSNRPVSSKTEKELQFRRNMYGTEHFNFFWFLYTYVKHHLDVFMYFRSRREDYIIINISKGEGWKELCNFLGVDTPDNSFPHANNSKIRNWSQNDRYIDLKLFCRDPFDIED
jgi:hypothetical protein